MRAVLYFLGCLNDLDITWFVSNGRSESLDPGDVLITAGQPLPDVFFVMEGELSVRIGDESAQEVNRMRYGEFAGEISFLDSRPPSATVVASTHARVLAISRETIEAHLATDPGFGARFYRGIGVLLSNRIRGLLQQVDTEQDADIFSEEVAGELDPDLLDSINLAGRRFELMLSLFRSTHM
jgi:CRP-like cAMP-binding protein